MKTTTILLLLFFPAVASANTNGIGDFFTFVSSGIEDFYNLFTNDVPSAIERFFAWAIKWAVYLKLYIQFESIKFAWGVASVILQDFAFGSTLQTLLDSLPQDVRAFLVVLRVMDALEIYVTAHLTRFVMTFI